MSSTNPVAAAIQAPAEGLADLSARVRGEYKEMPGLRLTVRQAARLFGIPPDVAGAVLQDLRRASILTLSRDGTYALATEPSRWRSWGQTVSPFAVPRWD